MHKEAYSISPEACNKINSAREAGKRIIAVGTTSVRVLETASDDTGKILPGEGETDIFIYPGYKFKMVDALITNFHLPESTLIMLVSAFAGREKIMKAYKEAINQQYRFFSFGDAMLIL
jgi:S-adenosylmethionine:tRNA ribosyltransferase-isomerase